MSPSPRSFDDRTFGKIIRSPRFPRPGSRCVSLGIRHFASRRVSTWVVRLSVSTLESQKITSSTCIPSWRSRRWLLGEGSARTRVTTKDLLLARGTKDTRPPDISCSYVSHLEIAVLRSGSNNSDLVFCHFAESVPSALPFLPRMLCPRPLDPILYTRSAAGLPKQPPSRTWPEWANVPSRRGSRKPVRTANFWDRTKFALGTRQTRACATTWPFFRNVTTAAQLFYANSANGPDFSVLLGSGESVNSCIVAGESTVMSLVYASVVCECIYIYFLTIILHGCTICVRLDWN